MKCEKRDENTFSESFFVLWKFGLCVVVWVLFCVSPQVATVALYADKQPTHETTKYTSKPIAENLI